MAQELCKNCNGQGLISTGDNKLDLKRGLTVVCPDCKGSGKVEDGFVGEKAESPKAEESSQSAPGGSDSSVSGSEGQPNKVVPQVGDRCLTADDKPGTLAKDEAGNWVCNPDE